MSGTPETMFKVTGRCPDGSRPIGPIHAILAWVQADIYVCHPIGLIVYGGVRQSDLAAGVSLDAEVVL